MTVSKPWQQNLFDQGEVKNSLLLVAKFVAQEYFLSTVYLVVRCIYIIYSFGTILVVNKLFNYVFTSFGQFIIDTNQGKYILKPGYIKTNYYTFYKKYAFKKLQQYTN